MVLLRFSRAEFLYLGLELAGFSIRNVEGNTASTNNLRFQDFFYACPKTVEDIFVDIQGPDLGESSISKPNPTYLLLALFHLKKYGTKYNLAALIDSSEKTALYQAKRYVQAIQALVGQKVSQHDCTNSENEYLFSYLVPLPSRSSGSSMILRSKKNL